MDGWTGRARAKPPARPESVRSLLTPWSLGRDSRVWAASGVAGALDPWRQRVRMGEAGRWQVQGDGRPQPAAAGRPALRLDCCT